MNLETWVAIVQQGFRTVRRVYGGDGQWWPGQREATVVAWGIAMQWAFVNKGLGTRDAKVWVSASGGAEWAQKCDVLKRYRVDPPDEDRGYSTNELRGKRFSRREYLLDFTIWPSDLTPRDLELTMESECYDSFEVETEIEFENGYAYDYYKLMLVPSPRRVFVCRVNSRREDRDARRARLLESLTAITRDALETGILNARDELSVLILAAAPGERETSILAVWKHQGGCFDSKSCDPAG
jgi:hypothetical protein